VGSPQLSTLLSERRRVALIGLALGFVALALGVYFGIGQSADPVLEAEKAYQKGDWNRAAMLSRERLKIVADDTEALRLLARSSARLGKEDSAIALYEKRLAGTALTTEDQYLRGLIIGRKGNLDLALSIWEKAASKPPDHAELLDGLARLAAQKNLIEEAAESAARLRRLPGWEARGAVMLGTFRSMMDDTPGAVDALELAFKIDPEAGESPFSPPQNAKLLARNLLRMGRPVEARRYLTKWLPAPLGSASENDTEANWLASRAYLQEGKIEEASSLNFKAGDYRGDHPIMPDPSPFVGSDRCESCHSEISKSYRESRHARSFYRDGSLLKLPQPDRALVDPDDPKVTHTVEREGDRLRVLSKVDDKVFKLVVDFAFGTPERYFSMVGRDEDGAYRAARLSYFHDHAGAGWDRTSGDIGETDSLNSVRGQKIDTRDGIVRCLGCHVTNPRDFRHPGKGIVAQSPAAADSSIGCERCHGPGTNHVAAAKTSLVHQTIANVGAASSKDVNNLCSDCHVVGSSAEIKKSPQDPRWVRSTGLTFTFSRCYTESSDALSCLTCHNPHRDSPRDHAFYEAKCLQCHSSATEAKTICKVSPAKDCVACHMPKVPMPVLHTGLTDHYIRVHPKTENDLKSQ